MSEFEPSFLFDSRVYAAVGITCVGMLLCSRRVLGGWPMRGRVKAEHVPLLLAMLVLPLIISLSAFCFVRGLWDFGDEFAVGILCAFGLVLSLRLVRYRGWFYRGAGVLLSFLYGYAIYSTLAAWMARGRVVW